MKSHLRQREGVRAPLNRIVKAAKMRREPVFGLSVSKIRGGALFLKLVGRLYKISSDVRAKARCHKGVAGAGWPSLPASVVDVFVHLC